MQAQEVRDKLPGRAQALGLEAATEEALIDALLEREVDVPQPTEQDCRRWYDDHPAAGRSRDMVEADHILFAVTERVPLAALRERAQQLLDELVAAPERFAQRAAEVSNCPSAQVGGELGQLRQHDVVPEFWQGLTATDAIGVLPQVIETRYGLHLVRVARRAAGRRLPFDAVRGQIMARLAERNPRRALRRYAHKLLHDDAAHAH